MCFDTLIVYTNADGRESDVRGIVDAGSQAKARDKALTLQTEFVRANVKSVEATELRAHRCIQS